MENEFPHPGSHLFTVRLWQEELGGGEVEWRGRAQNIATGAAAYFRDWPGLIDVLSHLVETTDAAPADPSNPSPF
jgi:hypothetical protein